MNWEVVPDEPDEPDEPEPKTLGFVICESDADGFVEVIFPPDSAIARMVEALGAPQPYLLESLPSLHIAERLMPRSRRL